MTRCWLISDTHYGQNNLYSVHPKFGFCMRPWGFDSAKEADEWMISQWNSVVREGDRVYHLGDMAISRKSLTTVVPKLNGRIVLIRGNHDIYKMKDYAGLVDDIRGFHRLGDFWLSHCPVHPNELRGRRNIHGHVHHKSLDDPRYINVSVEVLEGHRPINFEKLRR